MLSIYKPWGQRPRPRPAPWPALLLTAACAVLSAQQPQRLNLVVVGGQGAINNIKQRATRDTIIQVEDENHRPIAGAAVVFLLPNDGPGGEFSGGAKTVAMMTDNNGQAVMPRMDANQLTGEFQIRVNASYQGLQASTVITQSNAQGPPVGSSSKAAHEGVSGKVIGILVGVAAAGAVGAAVALKGGGNSQTAAGGSASAAPTGSITGPTGATLGPPR